MLQSVINISDQIQFDLFSITLRSDGLIRVKIKGNEDIDVPQVKQIVDAIEKIGKGKKFPLLFVVADYTLPTADARTYIAIAESNPFSKGEAFVVQSFPQKLVGNVFLSFNKPVRPTRIFNSEDKAIEWLKGFL